MRNPLGNSHRAKEWLDQKEKGGTSEVEKILYHGGGSPGGGRGGNLIGGGEGGAYPRRTERLRDCIGDRGGRRTKWGRKKKFTLGSRCIGALSPSLHKWGTMMTICASRRKEGGSRGGRLLRRRFAMASLQALRRQQKKGWAPREKRIHLNQNKEKERMN